MEPQDLWIESIAQDASDAKPQWISAGENDRRRIGGQSYESADHGPGIVAADQLRCCIFEPLLQG